MVASVVVAWSIYECKHNKICKYGYDYKFHKQALVEALWNCIQFENISWHLDWNSENKIQELLS